MKGGTIHIDLPEYITISGARQLISAPPDVAIDRLAGDNGSVENGPGTFGLS
jgi:hypothetical protein